MNAGSIERYLVSILGFFVILAVTGYYFAPHGQAHNFPTYLIAIIVLITPAFWRNIGDFRHKRSLLFATLLLAFLAISTLWSPEWNQKEVISKFGDLGLLLTFLAALSICYQQYERFYNWLFVALLLVAAITAALSIYHHVNTHGTELLALSWQRLRGWGGRIEHEVLAGLAYATAAQLSITMALTEPRRINALLYWLAFALLFYVVLLTQGRGPLLALFVGIAALAIMRGTRVKVSLVIPALLILVVASTAFFYVITKTEPTPADLAPAELEARRVNDNPHLDRIAPDGKPNGVKAPYAGKQSENIKQSENGVLILANNDDPSIAAVWPAFSIDPGAKYFISIRVKASKETNGGFTLRVEESDPALLDASHVATDANQNEAGVAEATRQVRGLVENRGLTTDWQEFTLEYTPTTTAKWASVLVMNDYAMGNAALFVDHLIIYEFDKGLFDLNLDRLEHAGHFLLRGINPRDLVWTTAIDESLADHPLFGAGISDAKGITARDGLTYDHAHSIYLSTLHYGGVVGLGLLLTLIFSLNHDIKRLTPSRERTVAFGMLVFALTAFAIDGDRILTKINQIWLMFWLPAGVLISIRPGHPRSGL